MLWHELTRVESMGIRRWCFGGDFNAILHHDERVSRSKSVTPPDRGFSEWVESCGLKELHASGPKFTWGRDGCSSKLDRVLITDDWSMKFQNASVLHLPKFKSDHCPLLVKVEKEGVRKKGNNNFRFFAPWVAHNDFHEVVKRSSTLSRSWDDNVQCFIGNVQEWNKKIFGNLIYKKKLLLRRMDYLNRRTGATGYKGDLKKEKEDTWHQLEEVLAQEEIIWLQRSRCSWYKEGDRNTKYFHSMANSRKKINNIEALKNEEGEWEYDKSKILQIDTQFFE